VEDKMSDKMFELMKDLEILVSCSKEDYDNNEHHSYERYLNEYNAILKSLMELGFESELRCIEVVPDGQKAYMGMGFSSAEGAKHREVYTEGSKLLYRLQKFIGIESNSKEAEKTIELILSRFHSVVRQLRDRYAGRQTLDIQDEYDVQDLLHSLLRVFFDDIRPEETTPSYAGGSKRMDFLIKQEKIVIEVKKTRNGLSGKEVGEQLLIDIATYREHPDCKTLICFVYDPEGRIGNPIGLENDLVRQSREGLKVVTYIFPK